MVVTVSLILAKVQRPEALTKHRVVERGALSTQKKEIEEEGWDPQHVDDDGDDGEEDDGDETGRAEAAVDDKMI